jgi:diguanylate cyclase (GGDEF)-like protein
VDNWERAMLAGRAAGLFVLGALWAFDAPTSGLTRFVVATALWIASSLVMTFIALRSPKEPVRTMLMIAICADLISLALLNSVLIDRSETIYSWYVATAVMSAVLLRRRDAWIAGGALTVSWLISYIGSPVGSSFTHLTLIMSKAVILLLLGAAVSFVTGKQEEDQADLEAQAEEVSDLNARLERSVAELRAVTEITELIHSTLEVEAVGPMLLEILEKVINIPSGSLYVVDKSKQETIFSASSIGAAATRTYSGLELAGAMPAGSTDGALSCIELVDHNRTVVVFCAETTAIDRLSADDRIVLQAVASELVVAVENSRLYRLTKRLAITDELTDLYNYRYLQQRLDDEMGRADRYSKRLSLLMLDLDDFKRINDLHGHLVGDRVLAEIGQLLKSTVREVDVVARYGGEEFTIILPETDASGAFIVAEKIREAISMHRFPDAEGGHSIHITVSIGLSSYPVHASDKESLLRSADDAVYHAKETGKDRVRAPRLRLRRVFARGPLKEAAE